MNGKILLHVRFGALYVRVWSDTVPNSSPDILLGTSSIDCFACDIIPSERKFVLWHSRPVAILVSPNHFKTPYPTTAVFDAPTGDTSKDRY